MDASSQFQLLAKYSRSANEAIYALCATIPDDVRRKDLGVFYKSVHGTLNHQMHGDQIWLARFNGQPVGHHPFGVDLIEDFDELREARALMDDQIITWVDALGEHWLLEPFTFTSTAFSQPFTRPAWIFVLHMFNHQTHHRGQLSALLMQLGYEPPVLDLPWIAGAGEGPPQA